MDEVAFHNKQVFANNAATHCVMSPNAVKAGPGDAIKDTIAWPPIRTSQAISIPFVVPDKLMRGDLQNIISRGVRIL
jgi:hypothetical protein